MSRKKNDSGDEEITTQKKSAGDVAHTIAKAGLSSIPLVGGAAAELFSFIFSPPYEKRRDKWIQSLADSLEQLTDRVDGIEYDVLQNNESFVTTALHASQAAIRNHQEEKLTALRNAVLNAALPSAPDDDLQLMFVSYVDYFTTWHLKILSFLNNPKQWFETRNIKPKSYYSASISAILTEAFPELSSERDFYDQVVTDLNYRGLISIDSLHGMMTERGLYESRTTEMGKGFLRFIEKPDFLSH